MTLAAAEMAQNWQTSHSFHKIQTTLNFTQSTWAAKKTHRSPSHPSDHAHVFSRRTRTHRQRRLTRVMWRSECVPPNVSPAVVFLRPRHHRHLSQLWYQMSTRLLSSLILYSDTLFMFIFGCILLPNFQLCLAGSFVRPVWRPVVAVAPATSQNAICAEFILLCRNFTEKSSVGFN